MFTGIVEEQGTVRAAQRVGDVLRLDIEARATLEGSELGASVAVNGACLTVVALRLERPVVTVFGDDLLIESDVLSRTAES